MTKTYDDIEAVTRLLEEVSEHSHLGDTLCRFNYALNHIECSRSAFRIAEAAPATNALARGCTNRLQKERDLELAARIGQSLLEQNKCLKQRHEELECELQDKQDEVSRRTFVWQAKRSLHIQQ